MCGPRGLAVPCPVISNWRATAPSGKQAQASLCTLQPVPSQQLGKQGVFMCLHVCVCVCVRRGEHVRTHVCACRGRLKADVGREVWDVHLCRRR